MQKMKVIINSIFKTILHYTLHNHDIKILIYENIDKNRDNEDEKQILM